MLFCNLTPLDGRFVNAIVFCRQSKFCEYIITYLVSSRPYIEICRVCKIYGRWGGAEPSIYFTNPTYFYVRSGTDQISVLFRWRPLFVYIVLCKIRKFICIADKLTTSMLARKCNAWRHIMTSLTPVWKSRLTLRFSGWENQGKSNINWL